MSTLKDIARLTKLSVSSVSYALNGKGSLSEETVGIVLDAARQLNYRPNKMARRLKTGISNLIGVIVNLDDMVNYSNKILNTLNSLCSQNGYTLIVVHNDRLGKSMEFMSENKVDGILYLATNYIDGRVFEAFGARIPEIPMVFINTWREDFAGSCVLYDEGKALCDITTLLLDGGHSRIGCVTGESGWQATKLRLAGFVDAVERAGLGGNRENIRFGSYYAERQAEVETMVDELVAKGVTAIVCFNDVIAATVYKVARERAIRIPGDLSVTGFDNQIFSNFLVPKLATVNIPVEGLSEAAFGLLMSKMDGSSWTGRLGIECAIVNNPSLGLAPRETWPRKDRPGEP